MRYRSFPDTEKKASVIALGSTYFGLGEYLEPALAQLDAFIEIGGNAIDSARVYGGYQPGGQFGDSEKAIGLWLKGRTDRDQLIIGTKGAHPDPSDMHKGRLDRQSILFDIEQSLNNLGLPCVDIYWLHRDDTSRDVGDIMETMNSLIDAGYTTTIGASNWTAKRLVAANEYAESHGLKGFAACQNMWSLAECVHPNDDTLVQMDREEYEFHVKYNFPIMPFSSQAKGYFMKLANGSLSPKAAARYDSPLNQETFRRLKEVSARTGHGIQELQLAYLICQPFPVFPIVGASSVEQVRAFEAGCDTILDEATLREIRNMLAPA